MGENPDLARMSRRHVIGVGMGSLLVLNPYTALAKVLQRPERALTLHNTHTDESLSRIYWSAGHYVPEVLAEFNHLLRDHRTGEAVDMAPGLLDLLYSVQRQAGSTQPVEVLSAYRSPKTNAMLRSRSRGVAKNSLHMQGMAVDFRIRGEHVSSLARLARDMQAGGVGYYPRSGFVHLDVGPVRTWRGR